MYFIGKNSLPDSLQIKAEIETKITFLKNNEKGQFILKPVDTAKLDSEENLLSELPALFRRKEPW